MTVTHDRLLELYNYNQYTGNFTHRISRRGPGKIGDIAGTLNANGYIYVGIDDKSYRAHRLAWLYVHGYWPEHEVDHINHIRHDNRFFNLREVTRKCNQRNRITQVNSTTGIKGVCPHKTSGYVVRLGRKHIGVSHNLREAVQLRADAEVEYGWRTCDIDSPASLYLREQ